MVSDLIKRFDSDEKIQRMKEISLNSTTNRPHMEYQIMYVTDVEPSLNMMEKSPDLFLLQNTLADIYLSTTMGLYINGLLDGCDIDNVMINKVGDIFEMGIDVKKDYVKLVRERIYVTKTYKRKQDNLLFILALTIAYVNELNVIDSVIDDNDSK